MRCQCCNKALSDYESVLKHPLTKEYLDICLVCLTDIPIAPLTPANVPLQHGEEMVELESEDEDEDAE